MGIRIVQIFTMNTASQELCWAIGAQMLAQILEINPQQNNVELKLKIWPY